MYQFVTGPLAWLSFAVFFIGLIVRTVWYIRGLDWKLDRVTYTVNTSYGIKGAIRSIIFWIFPWATRSYRNNPWFVLWLFLMHLGLLLVPVFLLGHNILLRERLGFSFWTLPEGVADLLTTLVIISVVFLVLRRIAQPEVRFLTTGYDYLVIAIAVAPFATGMIAAASGANYNFWIITHVLCGEVFLVAIPFTKLSHFVLFFLSRAQLGMDYGIKRGGMKKTKGMAW